MSHTSRGRRLTVLALLLSAAGCNQPGWDEDAEEIDGSEEPGVEAITGAATVGTALLVVSSVTTPKPGDVVLRQRLEAAGFSVVMKNSNAVTSDATNKKLVVISSTVDATRVTNKFRDVPIGVLVYEPSIFDDMGLTSGSNLGTKSSQDAVVISAANDVLAPGLSGTQIVTSGLTTFSWGKPGSNAVKVAKQVGDSTRAVIFRYEKGKGMVSGTAKGRRVGFFLGDLGPTLLNDTGLLLLDAAIRWAASLPALRSGGIPCLTSSECATGFCSPDGLCCDTACNSPCMNCRTKRGQCSPTEAGGTPRGGCFMDDQASCGNDGTCDGAGGCAKWPAGTRCAEGVCAGTFYFGPRSCDGRGNCQSSGNVTDCGHSKCTSSGCLSPCRNNDDCVTGAVCDTGLCVKRPGAPCWRDSECTSGFCADGFCCDTRCDGPCESCNDSFWFGHCKPDPAGTICQAAYCAGNNIIHPSRCDGAGACVTGGARACGDQICDAASDTCL